jgi:ribonucleoside-diphosphate reductase alpha chain
MYVTINFDEQNHPFEVFTTLGKAGGCDSAQLEAISRLVSLALRSGVDPKAVVEQLRGITCCPAWDNGILVRSAPDAVSLAMSRHLAGEEGPRAEAAQLKLFSEPSKSGGGHQPHNGAAPHTRCPDCNSPLAYQEGCLLCTSCGWNKCG